MAEESEEFKRLKEALGLQADLAEEELRIRHGITAKLDEHGQIERKSIDILDLGAKRRGKIEQDINNQLEKMFGKEQVLQNRKQVLYQKELENYVYQILEEREKSSERTLAQLYDPDKMPDGLREVHHKLDLAVERCYRSKPFLSDEERLEYLFKLYEQMIEEEKSRGTLFEIESKPKKKKK
jgi:hypothetical protein